ncbi:hypothetical protein GmHk_04G011314 [Glycine max]|nr:hypothetical protein GmHk_04G011314 [Glycine max]
MKVEVSKTKQLGVKLAKSRELDLNKHVGYLSSKSEENKALRNRVADLEQQVKDIGIEVEELVFENKVVKENLAITKDKVADLENTIEKLKSEM